MVLMAQRNESSLVKLAMPNIPIISDFRFTKWDVMTMEERKHIFLLQRIWENIACNVEKHKDDPLLFPSKAPYEVLAKMPMTIMWSAEFDTFLTETTRMANRLRGCGRLLELGILPGMNHAPHFKSSFSCYRVGMDSYKLAVTEYLCNSKMQFNGK